jgi:hypothetical protein
MFQQFYNGATGEPQRLQRRLAWQTDPVVPALTGFSDFISNGGALNLNPLSVERQAIRNTPMRQTPLLGKMDQGNGPLDMGDLDPAKLAQLMAVGHVLGKYDTTTLASGAYRHRLSQVKATAFPGWLTLLSDNDTGLPYRICGLMPSGFTVAAGPRQNVNLKVNTVPGKYDFWEDAVRTTGTGTATVQLRHTCAENFDDDTADEDVYMKVVSISGQDITCQFKIGSAATYSTNTVITRGNWTDVKRESGAYLGTQSVAERVQAYISTSGTVIANDIYLIAKRRDRWTPTYATEVPIAEVQTRVYLNGQQCSTEGGWQIVTAVPGAQRLEDTGGTQPSRTRRRGKANVQVQATRELVDLAFQKPLLKRDIVSLVLEGTTDVQIASTGYYFSWAWVLPSLRMTGNAYDADSGGDNTQEQVTFQAGEAASALSWNGMSFTADLEAVVQNDIALLV